MEMVVESERRLKSPPSQATPEASTCVDDTSRILSAQADTSPQAISLRLQSPPTSQFDLKSPPKPQKETAALQFPETRRFG
ncbi:MAG TPA: hypothetical protein VF627_02630 [Abditibacterium sp.]|jgi:hypothetical protein